MDFIQLIVLIVRFYLIKNLFN